MEFLFRSKPTRANAVSAILTQSLATFNVPGTQQQAVLATPEHLLSSKAGASGHSDSGYASVDGGSLESTPDTHPSPRNPFQRKVTKLKSFNKDISDLTKNRFKDLTELFEQPLYDYLIKERLRSSAISIKLKVLGQSEMTAKPWIVILCDEAVVKRVKQFFNQQHIKSEYQPCYTDSDLPSFEVFVCNRPPRPMAATAMADVFGDSAPYLKTLCGRAIKVVESHHTRFATLGGIIQITDWQHNRMLLGMTAGHILDQGRPEEDEADSNEVHVDAEGDEPSILSNEEEESFELELTSEDNLTAEDEDDLSVCGPKMKLTAEDVDDPTSFWPNIGRVSVASRETPKNDQDLDWALIALNDQLLYRSNLLVNPDVNHTDCASGELRELSSAIEGTGPDQPVVLSSGTSGLKRGKLSTTLSLLMLAPGRGFISTYNLALDDGSGKQALIRLNLRMSDFFLTK